MRIFKKLFLHSFKHYMIAAGAIVGFVIIFLAIKKFNLNNFPAAFATSGLIVTFIGLLLFLGYLGAFDTLGYSFTTFRSRERRPYKDLVEYTEVKSRNRKVKDYFFVPYIVVGLLFFVIGLVNWLFVKPLPKHEIVQNINIVELADNKLEISWDKDDKALNGYHLEITEYYDATLEKPEGLWGYDEKVAQSDSDRVTLIVSVPDTSKKYSIRIITLATKDYNGSDSANSTYDPE